MRAWSASGMVFPCGERMGDRTKGVLLDAALRKDRRPHPRRPRPASFRASPSPYASTNPARSSTDLTTAASKRSSVSAQTAPSSQPARPVRQQVRRRHRSQSPVPKDRRAIPTEPADARPGRFCVAKAVASNPVPTQGSIGTATESARLVYIFATFNLGHETLELGVISVRAPGSDIFRDGGHVQQNS